MTEAWPSGANRGKRQRHAGFPACLCDDARHMRLMQLFTIDIRDGIHTSGELNERAATGISYDRHDITKPVAVQPAPGGEQHLVLPAFLQLPCETCLAPLTRKKLVKA